jgi:hypothetical protein
MWREHRGTERMEHAVENAQLRSALHFALYSIAICSILYYILLRSAPLLHSACLLRSMPLHSAALLWVCLIPMHFTCILLHSVVFYFILLHSAPFCSNLLRFDTFCCVSLHSVASAAFRSILLHLLHFAAFYCITSLCSYQFSASFLQYSIPILKCSCLFSFS